MMSQPCHSRNAIAAMASVRAGGASALPRGEGANGEWTHRTLHVRACPSLAQATLMTTSPLYSMTRIARPIIARRRARDWRAMGGDCYAYCMLASGFIDLIVEANLKPYDIVALVPISRAPGNRHELEGGEAANGGASLAAGDRRVA